MAVFTSAAGKGSTQMIRSGALGFRFGSREARRRLNTRANGGGRRGHRPEVPMWRRRRKRSAKRAGDRRRRLMNANVRAKDS